MCRLHAISLPRSLQCLCLPYHTVSNLLVTVSMQSLYHQAQVLTNTLFHQCQLHMSLRHKAEMRSMNAANQSQRCMVCFMAESPQHEDLSVKQPITTNPHFSGCIIGGRLHGRALQRRRNDGPPTACHSQERARTPNAGNCTAAADSHSHGVLGRSAPLCAADRHFR